MYPYALVSVIIPVYNSEKYLAQSINSALAQTWPAIEIIIIDDGSSDNSLEIAKGFKNENIKVFTQSNKGASAARNYGLTHAKGSYIQFLDADDLLSPDKIELQMIALNNNSDLIALCDMVYFNDGTDPYLLKPLKEWYNADWDDPVDFLLKLYIGHEIMPGYGGMIQPNSWLTPRQLINKAGLWNEFKCPDDDGEFFCRVILASKGLRYTKGINYYRKHDSGTTLSGQKSREAFQNSLMAIDLKHSYLKAKTNDKIVDRIFAKHYWDIGVRSFPQFKDISNKAISKAEEFGYCGPKYVAGKLSTMLSKLLGWRLLRILSYWRYGF